MRRTGMHILPAALLTLLAAAGCATSECLDNRNAIPLAGFYSSSDVPEPIEIGVPLTVYGLDAADTLIRDANSLGETTFPFRIDDDNTAFVIEYGGDLAGLSDTVRFSYDAVPFFESVACGAFYRFDMRAIAHTTYLIDSVTCPSGVIDNRMGQNLHIYFRTKAES